MYWDFRKEVQRKLIHLSVAVIILAIILFVNSYFGKQAALLCLVFLLLLFLIVDFFRVELNQKIPLLHPLWRTKEDNKFGGQIFFIIGAIIAFAAFDLKIALAAVLMATFGDSIAAIVGRIGRIRVSENKSLEGILAEFVVNLAIAYFIIGDFWIMLIMALIATLVETLVNELDDNLFTSIFSGFAGQLTIYVINYMK